MFQLSASIPNIEKGFESIVKEMHVKFSFHFEGKRDGEVIPVCKILKSETEEVL